MSYFDKITENRPGRAHRDGPDTEQDAALAVAGRTGGQRGRVYGMLDRVGAVGMTDWELTENLGESHTAIGARRNELVRMGYVEDSGQKRVGPYGLNGIVWVVIERKD